MSGYPWFRLYHEARIDAKLRTLPCEQFRVWFNLLCYSAENHLSRGTVPAMDDDLLAVEVANGDTDLLCATVERLKKLRILEVTEDDGLHFIHFEQRQFDKPSARPERNADRQRRLRERRRAEAEDENSNASNTKSRARNTHVTPRHAQSNASNTTDKKRRDTEETRREDNSASAVTPSSSSDDTQQHTREPLTLVRTSRVNPIWDMLVEVFEHKPETKDERSNWGKIVKDLKEAGATADPPMDDAMLAAEIRRRARNHAEGVRNGSISWPLTPNALNNHWGELAKAPRPLRDRAARNASNTPADDSDDALSRKAQSDMQRYAAVVGEE